MGTCSPSISNPRRSCCNIPWVALLISCSHSLHWRGTRSRVVYAWGLICYHVFQGHEKLLECRPTSVLCCKRQQPQLQRPLSAGFDSFWGVSVQFDSTSVYSQQISRPNLHCQTSQFLDRWLCWLGWNWKLLQNQSKYKRDSILF